MFGGKFGRDNKLWANLGHILEKQFGTQSLNQFWVELKIRWEFGTTLLGQVWEELKIWGKKFEKIFKVSQVCE